MIITLSLTTLFEAHYNCSKHTLSSLVFWTLMSCACAAQEHVSDLLGALIVLLAEDEEAIRLSAWTALNAVSSTVSKEDQPQYVRVVKEAILSARELERRKRRGGPLLVHGLLVTKGIAPLLPIYLQASITAHMRFPIDLIEIF